MREIKRFFVFVRNIRRYGPRLAWRFYRLMRKVYAGGSRVQIEEEA